MTVTMEEPDTYALGRDAAETDRLMLQHQLYGPLTRGLLTAAGIGRGMHVLDLGCGAGDVSLLLADMVGPEGRVVSVDGNAAILATVRERAAAARLGNIETIHADVRALDLPDRFDAVVGRWVLMYVPDPVDLLRRLQTLLRPGGLVVFQESDLTRPVRTYPAGPVHELVNEWTAPVDGGPAVDMGPRLRQVFVAAGLAAPQLHYGAPIGGGADWPGYEYVAATIRSLLPFLEQLGGVAPADVGIDTLASRLRDEVVELDGVQVLPAVIGAWSRRD